jgi:hypothetical protein
MRVKSWVVGVVVGVVVATGVGIAFAAVPSSSGAIHGCYNPSAGYKLRVLDTAKTARCPSGWKALSWNQSGPRGLPGVQGVPGVSGYTVVTATIDVSTTTITGTADAVCPTGKVPIGGGYNGGGFLGDVTTMEDGPILYRDANQAITGGAWRVSLHVFGSGSFGGPATITVSAICADIA